MEVQEHKLLEQNSNSIVSQGQEVKRDLPSRMQAPNKGIFFP